jgi:hypothetical protein
VPDGASMEVTDSGNNEWPLGGGAVEHPAGAGQEKPPVISAVRLAAAWDEMSTVSPLAPSWVWSWETRCGRRFARTPLVTSDISQLISSGS